MAPLSPLPGSSRPPKRKADEELATLFDGMRLASGDKPSGPGPQEKKTKIAQNNFQGSDSSPAKRKASVDLSAEAGPLALADLNGPQKTEPRKRTRLIPRGQLEKSYTDGDRDFQNPDGSRVHKPNQGPVTTHFGHGTVVIDNGGTVKIDHPDGTTVISNEGQAPSVIRPFGKAPSSLPNGGRLEHMPGGDVRVHLLDRVVTHFGSGLTRTEMDPGAVGQRGYYETDSNGDHRFVGLSSSEL